MTVGVPSSQTIEKVFSIIDHKKLEDILVGFYNKVILNVIMSNDLLNVDGRVNCGS